MSALILPADEFRNEAHTDRVWLFRRLRNWTTAHGLRSARLRDLHPEAFLRLVLRMLGVTTLTAALPTTREALFYPRRRLLVIADRLTEKHRLNMLADEVARTRGLTSEWWIGEYARVLLEAWPGLQTQDKGARTGDEPGRPSALHKRVKEAQEALAQGKPRRRNKAQAAVPESKPRQRAERQPK